MDLNYVHIGLTQLGTRCGNGSCEAAEDLIAGFPPIKAEAKLVQVRLELPATTVISAEQKRFQVADDFVQPMQVTGRELFCIQRNAGQVTVAFITVALNFCTWRNRFVNGLLERFARDIFNNVHPREQSRAIFRF